MVVKRRDEEAKMEVGWGGGSVTGAGRRGCQARIRDEIRSRRCLSQETISIHTLPPPARSLIAPSILSISSHLSL